MARVYPAMKIRARAAGLPYANRRRGVAQRRGESGGLPRGPTTIGASRCRAKVAREERSDDRRERPRPLTFREPRRDVGASGRRESPPTGGRLRGLRSGCPNEYLLYS